VNTAKGIAVWLALAAYRLGRAVVALLGLAALVGDTWAALLLVLMAAAGCNALLQVVAFAALLRLWHWPWPLAAVAVAPRLLLVLPGLITTRLARWRHPRPLWTAPAGQAARAAAPAALGAPER